MMTATIDSNGTGPWCTSADTGVGASDGSCGRTVPDGLAEATDQMVSAGPSYSHPYSQARPLTPTLPDNDGRLNSSAIT